MYYFVHVLNNCVYVQIRGGVIQWEQMRKTIKVRDRQEEKNMSTRERIISVRLLEKAARQPGFAELLGIQGYMKKIESEEPEEPP